MSQNFQHEDAPAGRRPGEHTRARVQSAELPPLRTRSSGLHRVGRWSRGQRRPMRRLQPELKDPHGPRMPGPGEGRSGQHQGPPKRGFLC